MLNDRDYVLKQIEERDIHFIRLWFTDVLGNLKSLAVTDSEIDTAMEEGMCFDGSSISGFRNVEEPDLLAFPIPDTFQVLPWRPKTNGVARMFCELHNPDGEPFHGDPRHVLRKVMDKARGMGFVPMIGSEIEYYYFESDQAPVPIDNAGYFDLTSADHASDLRRDTILTLEKMSIPVEYSHHEYSPSQQEIDLRFSDALAMADSVMTYRLVVKEIALSHGVYASFMPMPLEGQSGCGMHLHQSLIDKMGNNVFFDAADPNGIGLSDIGRHYAAGLLKYAPEYMAVTNQYVNSYKRLNGPQDVSRYMCWGRSNRSAMLRIPSYRRGSEMAARIEVRLADPAANPYLAFAAMIAAGLKGIEEGLELPAPCDGLVLPAMTAQQREEAGIGELPSTLTEAIDIFERSEFMRELLGDHIFNYIVRAKRAECAEYLKTITQWEIDRYLPVL